MTRALLLAAATLALAPAPAAADLTPEGPATLLSRWDGAVTAEGRPPEVLVAAKLTVGPGGSAGAVRVRAINAGVNQASEPVALPAEPGTYTFPAPHIRWDYRSGRLGIDQTTGGHALVTPQPCTPELGRWADLCQLRFVDVFTPPGGDGTPANTLAGASLSIDGVVERDLDEDLLGDETEDRTDLRLSAVSSLDRDGRLRAVLTLTNAGPLQADIPSLETTAVKADWEGCVKVGVDPWYLPRSGCRLAPLAPGASVTVTQIADADVPLFVSARAEGPDLDDGDNRVPLALPSGVAPGGKRMLVRAARVQSLRGGVKVKLTATRTGRARVTLALGKARFARVVALQANVARTITLRPTGAKLRSLRRHTPARATITVKPLDGGAGSATAKVRLRR